MMKKKNNNKTTKKEKKKKTDENATQAHRVPTGNGRTGRINVVAAQTDETVTVLFSLGSRGRRPIKYENKRIYHRRRETTYLTLVYIRVRVRVKHERRTGGDGGTCEGKKKFFVFFF